MAVEERRCIALHRAAAATWGEKVAETLAELVAPSGHESATRADIQGVLAAMAAMDERLTGQIAALDERWYLCMLALRHEVIGAVDRRFADAVALQARTLVVSQLVALVVIAGLAFGLR